jgi:hypothetical protein
MNGEVLKKLEERAREERAVREFIALVLCDDTTDEIFAALAKEGGASEYEVTKQMTKLLRIAIRKFRGIL